MGRVMVSHGLRGLGESWCSSDLRGASWPPLKMSSEAMVIGSGVSWVGGESDRWRVEMESAPS